MSESGFDLKVESLRAFSPGLLALDLAGLAFSWPASDSAAPHPRQAGAAREIRWRVLHAHGLTPTFTESVCSPKVASDAGHKCGRPARSRASSPGEKARRLSTT